MQTCETPPPPLAVVLINEPPTKKAKPTMDVHPFNCCDEGTLGKDEAAEFLSNLRPTQLALLAQIVKKQQEDSKDSYVFSYQNVNNNKTMQYVRVPRNKLDDTDESFTKTSAWIEKAIDINCGAEDDVSRFNSRKRLAKY